MTFSIRDATGDDAEEVVALTRELARFERMEDDVTCRPVRGWTRFRYRWTPPG